jgi:hypothetical protein
LIDVYKKVRTDVLVGSPNSIEAKNDPQISRYKVGWLDVWITEQLTGEEDVEVGDRLDTVELYFFR